MSWERKVQKKPSWSSSTQAPRESLFKTQGFSKPVEEPVEKIALKPIQFRGRDTSHLDHIKVNSDRPIVTPRVNLSTLQTKLTVGAPGDKYEQEADSMAQKVMSTPDSAVQRMTPEEEEEVRTKPLAANITPLVQREEMPQEEKEEVQAKLLGNGTIQCEEIPEEKEIQTKPLLQRTTDGSFQAGGSIESQLNSSKGGGSPLGDNVRGFMEPRFGADFSSVRVHTGDEAVQMNRELGAQAFTHGSDVYFGAGKAPGNNELTAHELTHVVQQTGGVYANFYREQINPSENHYTRDSAAIRKLPEAPQVQKSDPVSAASLGLAIFESGRSITSSGSLSHNANTPSYMHEQTPKTANWENVLTELHIKANHPRYGIGTQHFYYRLKYQRNGFDIRNAQVDVLRDKSSGMYTSAFGSTWSGQNHSQPVEEVAQIVFNISGEWNPFGRGDFSWWGELILSATKGGSSYESFSIGSEDNYVYT